MKSKDNEYTLIDLVRHIFEECELTDQVNEMDVVKTYKSVVGDLISKLTLDIKLKDKTLYLKLSSAALNSIDKGSATTLAFTSYSKVAIFPERSLAV